MSAKSFAQQICSAIKGAVGDEKAGGNYNDGTPAACQSAIANAITNYLIANVTVHAAYNGMTTSTPSAPDIVPDEHFKIAGACAPTSTPKTFDAWVKDLESKIVAGFLIVVPGINAVTTTPFKPFMTGGLTISQANLKSAHEGNMKDPMEQVWTVVCQGILDWINNQSAKNASATGLPATRPGSVGTVTLTTLEVS